MGWILSLQLEQDRGLLYRSYLDFRLSPWDPYLAASLNGIKVFSKH